MPAPANPFPGLNPYFEMFWSDVHTALIGYVREALSAELPGDLSVRAEEHVSVAGSEKPGYRPDVAVIESWRDGFPPIWQPEDKEGGALAVSEPLVILQEPVPERWIEIRDVHGTLVTAIEILSPTNKARIGCTRYLEKQQDFLCSGVNLVEIDLLRGGLHIVSIDLESLDFRGVNAPQLVCVARRGFSHRREVYPCPLRSPLPTIRVPLRLTDPDAPLALQPLIDRCYRSGRYWLTDYRTDPIPPVPAEDLAWMDERLRAAGLR